jgi:hypothetical protein
MIGSNSRIVITGPNPGIDFLTTLNLRFQAFVQAFHTSTDMLNNLKANLEHWSAVEVALQQQSS